MVAASLDLTSAFDTVSSPKLIRTLEKAGVQPYLLRWLRDYVTKRSCIIKVRDNEHRYPVFSACPQGSPLSPLLFALFINPLLELVLSQNEETENNTDCGIQAYADDILVYATGKNDTVTQAQLQTRLCMIENWCNCAGLSLNPSKCVTIRFSKKRGGHPEIRQIIAGDSLQEYGYIKYLGILLDSRLTWQHHIKLVKQKPSKKTMALRKMIGKKWGLNPSIVSAIVHGALLPAIYYGSPIWASVVCQPASLLTLESITRQLGILISGCLKTTSYPAVYTLSGLKSPDLEITQRLIMFGRRLWASDQLQFQLNPPTCTNSSKLNRRLRSESNRIQKAIGQDDFIRAPKITAWGIAPHESELLFQPRDLSIPTAPAGEGTSALSIVLCLGLRLPGHGDMRKLHTKDVWNCLWIWMTTKLKLSASCSP